MEKFGREELCPDCRNREQPRHECGTEKCKDSIAFTLSGYHKKKDEKEDKGFVFSRSFYTHPKGYHMTLRVHPDGRRDTAIGVPGHTQRQA